MAVRKKYLIIAIIVYVYLIANNAYCKTLPPDVVFKDDKIIKLINLIKTGKYSEVNNLLIGGVDINYKSKDGVTPLYYFFMIKNYKGFKKCLELGASPNVFVTKVGLPDLLHATMYINDDKYFNTLLKYNVDVNYKREKRGSPLKLALFSEVNIKYLKMLLEYGINMNYSDWSDNPLLIALSNREYKKVILLFEYGAKLDDTEIFYLYKGEYTIKKLFIERLEEYRQFPYSQLYRDQFELVKYLKERFGIEVKPNYPDNKK